MRDAPRQLAGPGAEGRTRQWEDALMSEAPAGSPTNLEFFAKLKSPEKRASSRWRKRFSRGRTNTWSSWLAGTSRRIRG